jgi:hypothetical protein
VESCGGCVEWRVELEVRSEKCEVAWHGVELRGIVWWYGVAWRSVEWRGEWIPQV